MATATSAAAPLRQPWPHVTVPAGFYSGLPIGLSFFGAAWSEPALLKLAYS